MRKITKQMAIALLNKQTAASGNTAIIESDNGGYSMTLHGNVIATYKGHNLTVMDAGWQTNTTKERLNGILSVFETRFTIKQVKGTWFVLNACDDSLTAFSGALTVRV